MLSRSSQPAVLTILTASLMACSCLSLAQPAAQAAEPPYQLTGPPSPELIQAIKKIAAAANAGARKGPAAAKSYWQQAGDEAQADPRLHLAYALLLIQNHHYSEAGHVLGKATRDARLLYWPAWKAAIWLRLLAKDAAGALRLVEQLCDRASKLPPADANRLLDADAAAWLGRACACLNGPLAKHGLEAELERVQNRLETLLGKDRRRLYAEQRDRTLQRYAELMKVLEAQRQAAAKSEVDRRKQIKELADQARRALNDQIHAANEEAKKWDEWLQHELAGIDKRQVELDRQRTETSSDLQYIAAAIDTAQAREAYYASLAAEAEDDGKHELAAYYRGLADMWGLEAASHYAAYGRAQATLASTLAELAQLQRQRQSASERHRRERDRIMQEIKQLRRTQMTVERRLAKTVRNREASKARQLRAIFASARTYLHFDPERELELLLETAQGPAAGRR